MHPEIFGSTGPLHPLTLSSGPGEEPSIIVPGPGPGTPMPEQGATPDADAPDDADDTSGPAAVMALVEQPAKVMRIGSMIKQLLDEVRSAPLDDASRQRLADIHRTSIRELSEGLAPELREELTRLALPFSDDGVPSDAELRIAHAQLVGWLEGVFHGIQTALFAQQMSARAQLEQMRNGALPSGDGLGPDGPGLDGPSTGQYL
ncbi:bacterial proteasome activator family protein [Gordonia caeni]|uniref:Bacterial proteasome activator n=1 Tax=Gordonia caeni TaxID=1007097 RepID=A0ABP7NIM3_9ACTN